MKVNLVVTATGPNQGRSIPVSGAKFVIGRDPGCHLRPASQAISKQHCAIHLRNGQVWVQDFGSTNGTLLNDVAVSGEAQAKDGDSLKLGPLEFKLQIIPSVTPADGTPLPEKLKPLSNVGTKKLSSVATKPAPATTPAAPVPIKSASAEVDTADNLPAFSGARAGGDDDAAAMLLGMEDTPSGEAPSVPEGSTVMEVPAIDAAGRPIPPKPADKKNEAAESSNAAGDLLKKYFRRTSS
jgi:pSer/pThr/pTyr-binding forkhead associated (FHA) protein